MTTVAVMQPYFVPYAGYFRLFEVADLFVVYDCVQFPRRGWVHRNRLPDRDGRPAWLTLPVERAPQRTMIRDVRVAPDAPSRLEAAVRRFPSLAASAEHPLVTRLLAPAAELCEHVVGLLAEIRDALRIDCPMVRSSTLDVPRALTGQDRVLAIAQAVGAKRYVNAPGGRSLYDRAAFEKRGIALSFLTPFVDAGWSVLFRLLNEPAAAVANDISEQAVLDG